MLPPSSTFVFSAGGGSNLGQARRLCPCLAPVLSWLYLTWASTGAGHMPEPMAAFYFAQLLRAVQFMHDHGFCHRDIKPENCMVDRRTNQVLTRSSSSTLVSPGPLVMVACVLASHALGVCAGQVLFVCTATVQWGHTHKYHLTDVCRSVRSSCMVDRRSGMNQM
jgi:serine/threonine protein kinase